MNALFGNSLVGLVLLASIGYAVLALGPKTLRNRLLAALSRVLALAPASLGLGRVARRLAAASTLKPQGGVAACGGCDTCGAPEGSAAQSTAEVNVPVANIGRRDSQTPAAARRR